MDELISREVQGLISDIEEAKLLAWRRESPANELYYQNLAALLRVSREVCTDEVAFGPPPIEDLIGRQPAGWLGLRSSLASRGFWRAVGVGLASAAVVGSLLLVPHRFEGYRSLLPVAPALPVAAVNLGTQEIVTRGHETTTLTLNDGSVVRLAPESRLRVTGAAGSREVWLEGRAYFAITADKDRPFLIRTHAGDALVIGTRFDLEAREDDLRLLVVEGEVKVAARGEEVQVQATQVARVSKSLPLVMEDVEPAQMKDALKWLDRFIVFEDTPLSQAVEELSAHFGVPIVLLDEGIAASTVRGVFTDESLEDVVKILCRAVSAQCTIGSTGVSIGP